MIISKLWLAAGLAIVVGCLLSTGFVAGCAYAQGRAIPPPTHSTTVTTTPISNPPPYGAGPITHSVIEHQIIGNPIAETHGTVRAKLESGSWTFSDPNLNFKFDNVTGDGVYTTSFTYAGRVYIDQKRNGDIKAVNAELWEVVGDTLTRQLPVANWQFDATRPNNDPISAFENSVGIGISINGFNDIKPAITYSPFRISRIRPSVMADTGGNVGAGLQFRFWKPFHLGGFATKKLSAWDEPMAIRITATVNL